jgi:hypothetical protein
MMLRNCWYPPSFKASAPREEAAAEATLRRKLYVNDRGRDC